MIPKKIHYCWVGGSEKPESVLACISSWKKYCPDYEIIEWNEDNYDFSKNTYMSQAYTAKKWGFVPDYARLDIVYEHGGIYLDTDVELIRSIDELLHQRAFMGFEDAAPHSETYYVSLGLGFGAEPHNSLIGVLRDYYNQLIFVNRDNTLNLTPSPEYSTAVLRQYGLIQNNQNQKIGDIQIYNTRVLCPKNYTTGEIVLSDDTVSIHHFTASWQDERVRAEHERKKRLSKLLGEKGAYRFLYFESILQKYMHRSTISQLPHAIWRKLKQKIIAMYDTIPYWRSIVKAKLTGLGHSDPVILDTSLQSQNCGDAIIVEHCLQNLPESLSSSSVEHVSTHEEPTETCKTKLRRSMYKIILGTNILSGDMMHYGLWRTGIDITPFRNTVLMGVGTAANGMQADAYTRKMLRTVLSSQMMHSVRDRETEKFLRQTGINNVLYTGCPSMWGITPERCREIPVRKGKEVVFTVTDYCQDSASDIAMVACLKKNYEVVHVWIQGSKDQEYLEKLEALDGVNIVGNSLKEYKKLLEKQNLDYVGTRLHAGIEAINAGHRAIIIAVDTRAKNIAYDTGLPIILREDVAAFLETRINSEWQTTITMPDENIQKWKKQFI